MDDRTQIAAMALQGILVGMFGDRPTARPAPEKIAAMAVEYADNLLSVVHTPPQAPEPL